MSDLENAYHELEDIDRKVSDLRRRIDEVDASDDTYTRLDALRRLPDAIGACHLALGRLLVAVEAAESTDDAAYLRQRSAQFGSRNP